MSITLEQPPSAHAKSPTSVAGADVPVGRRRGWAAAGLAAGIGAIAYFIGPASMLTASTDSLIDNVLVAEEIEGKEGLVWMFQTGGVLLAMLVVVFGLGLRRRLAAHEPAGSLTPDAAALGMVLVAALTLVGSGIGTEFFHSLRHSDEVDPDSLSAQLMIYNTLGWVWAGGLLTTLAVAVAGIRRRSVGRGLGWFAAVMSGIIILSQVTPFQYMAVLPVSLFLIVAGISMLRSEGDSADKFRGVPTDSSVQGARYHLDG